MARNVRIEFAGAWYHVTARGNRDQDLFLDDTDRGFFLRTLGQACSRTGWRVHAWVLMGSHYHLLIDTPEPNLVEGMKWLQNTYTRRFNTRHKLWGRLFGDRYKAVLVEGGEGWYFTTLLDFIHLNPVREGLVQVREGGSVFDYPWSSARRAYATIDAGSLPWSRVEEGLAAFGFGGDMWGRRAFMERLDQRARQEGREAGLVVRGSDARGHSIGRGWYWGSKAFSEKCLALARPLIRARRNATYRSGDLNRAHDIGEASRIIDRALEVLDVGPAELVRTPGSDPRKLAIAHMVIERTTVRRQWLAERLFMRSAGNVTQQVAKIQREQRGSRRELFDAALEKLGIFD
jgi:putative transposase